jgi:predicted ATP-dependent serine protease
LYKYGGKMQRIIVKPQTANQRFTFNTKEVDDLFPGFTLGEFAVIHGSSTVSSLMPLLCIRAQLPTQLGGLASNVIFIDGGNTFTQNNMAHIAQQNHLNPITARQKIFNFTAFTAYQLTSLIMDRLEEKILTTNAKLVIVSDIGNLFLDPAISKEEIQRVYNQIINQLSNLAKKYEIIIIATCPSHEGNIRNLTLKEMTLNKANTVISYYKTAYTAELNLEKHSTYMLGTAEPPSKNIDLTSFM